MKAFFSKFILCTMLILVSLVSQVDGAQAAACASPAAAISCVLNQQMWLNGGGDGFGGAVRLGQSFVPSATGRICKIALLVRKNNPAAGPLTLRVRVGGPGGAQLAGGAAARVIPMGGPQAVDFNFGCTSGPLVQRSTRYFLDLSAGNSPPLSYTWINSQGAGGNVAYPAGQGWHSTAGWRPYDYAFRVYLCR
jgi:hypothetical protein